MDTRTTSTRRASATTIARPRRDRGSCRLRQRHIDMYGLRRRGWARAHIGARTLHMRSRRATPSSQRHTQRHIMRRQERRRRHSGYSRFSTMCSWWSHMRRPTASQPCASYSPPSQVQRVAAHGAASSQSLDLSVECSNTVPLGDRVIGCNLCGRPPPRGVSVKRHTGHEVLCNLHLLASALSQLRPVWSTTMS